MNPEPFFAFARERHNIYLRRKAGAAEPWTDDPILYSCRFTNVYRELDKTTVWFREHIRDRLRDSPEVLPATVLFRWFNRISTGEALFSQNDLLSGISVFDDIILNGFDHDHVRYLIESFCGDGPYVTGAFIINTPTGMTKLDGVLWAFGEFMENSNWRVKAEQMLHEQHTMEETHNWLKQFHRLGDFMAYEIVCDLRYTKLLENAPDIKTWANPGPGAKRGLSYLLGGARKVVPLEVKSRDQQIVLIKKLLDMAPQYGWTDWEMREVEHTLCEYAKYEMVKRGEGKTKGMFR